MQPKKEQIKGAIDPGSEKTAGKGTSSLPPLKGELIKKIAASAKNIKKSKTGTAIIALFAGPPGTGKTQAAKALAAEIGMDLYRIDLSAIVSKYIGETEKNLSRVFAKAEKKKAILFFDEADALFAKRTGVRNSHDRYTNIEANYLLQKLEEYSAVAILTTNHKKQLDEALLRRLQFVVEFP